jgi:hypothetical protein
VNKWKSETTGLESKEQLKAHRAHKWLGLLSQNNLDLFLTFWWTQEEKVLEQTLWVEADIDYEVRKQDLKKQLDLLTDSELSQYMEDIGISDIGRSDISVWLSPSPAN